MFTETAIFTLKRVFACLMKCKNPLERTASQICKNIYPQKHDGLSPLSFIASICRYSSLTPAPFPHIPCPASSPDTATAAASVSADEAPLRSRREEGTSPASLPARSPAPAPPSAYRGSPGRPRRPPGSGRTSVDAHSRA